MNLLSIGAAYGVVAYLAEGGWAGQLVGIDTPTPVPPFIPVMMFAILFGLSMDYEVFLLQPRPRGVPGAAGDTSRAVAEGLARTARVITAAALIMVAVFGAFALSPEVFLKLIGIGMADGDPDRRDDRADGAGAGGDAAARRPQLVAAALARPAAARAYAPGSLTDSRRERRRSRRSRRRGRRCCGCVSSAGGVGGGRRRRGPA